MVQSALPAIDTGPPAYRSHVVMKLKKHQKELERSKDIEHANFLLLQKMNYITRTSRVDNAWKSPQPNMTHVNKVAMYDTARLKIEDILFEDFAESDDEEKPRSRRVKCAACSSHLRGEPDKIPEERVPWEPTKKPVGRQRSQSVPSRKPEPLPTITDQSREISSGKKSTARATSGVPKYTKTKRASAKEPQSITLTRGCLKLSLNFPSDTRVKFQEGGKEKYLMRGFCYCKNSPVEIF